MTSASTNTSSDQQQATPTAQDIGGDAQTADNAADNTGAQDTAASADAGMLTQDQFNKALQDRLARAQKAADGKLAALQADIAARDAELEKHRQAALTEDERRNEQYQAALARAAELEAKTKQAEVSALRSNLIMAKCPSLPVAYKHLVSGDSAEQIEASIVEALAQFEADRAEILRAAPPGPNLGTNSNTGASPATQDGPADPSTLAGWLGGLKPKR